jgi:hypothetical protein
MKVIKYFISQIFGTLVLTTVLQAQIQSGVDSTGLPGDNFDLQGALQMFQNSASIEDFEKAINAENNHVNNLDLDGDGDIDYVRVVSKMEKEVHVFILQVPVSATENQDIAAIELEKNGKESAVIQILGDEDIYGEQVIAEPDGDGNESAFNVYENPGNLSGPNAIFENYIPGNVINVWFWPSVRFVYGPAYRPWISPWRWHTYPNWWKPWKPLGWHVWHPYRVHYHKRFVIVLTHRVIHAHKIYTPYRSSSVVVRNRHSASVNNYRVTRTKTNITGPRGRTTTVKKTKVTGPKGGKVTKTKVRRHR